MLKSKLARPIILGLLLGTACQNFVAAADHSTVYINGGGKQMFEVLYCNIGDSLYVDPSQPPGDENTIVESSAYELTAQQKTGLEKGLSYWAELLGANAKNPAPTQIILSTSASEGNASAANFTVNFTAKQTIDENFIKSTIQNGESLPHFSPFTAGQPTGIYAFSAIEVGQYLGAKKDGTTYGWYIDADTALPENEQAADFVGTVRHEMGHALGIAVSLDPVDPAHEINLDDYGNNLVKFSSDTNTAATSWNMHLVDQNLNPAKPGREIITTDRYAKIAADDPTVKPTDYFIVDNTSTTAPYDTTNPRAGKLYFIGSHVTEALNGATFDGVSGLPINAWEAKSADENTPFFFPEFSHIQTLGMMSHVSYSNYTSFLEVELAAMQDLGYSIDRRNYYGFSEYGNNQSYTNTNGYSARNSDGTAYLPGVYNYTPLGIGLHVYGSGNTITQAADILTQGNGAVGMRIDGANNTITLQEGINVKADGYQGIGALISYGSGQVLNQAGTISALGDKGIGVRFDFGSSTNGASDEYRGSYIRYVRDVDNTTGKINSASNIPLTGDGELREPTPELNGPLVKEYNLSGSLSGAANAIYIGKNAFVENINFNEGASVQGNITSHWKHFATDGSYDGGGVGGEMEPLVIQYKDNIYAYDQYIPDLVTNLNVNAKMNYSGTISGPDNIRLNVGDGAVFNYTGSADVVDVEIASNGALQGNGSLKVNDLTASLADGFSDAKMGKVINHGTISALNGDLSIIGDLVSNGSIYTYCTSDGSNVYLLQVDGNADINGSKLFVGEGNNKPILNKKYTYLTATNGITGSITPQNISPYLTPTNSVEGNNAYFSVIQTKKLGSAEEGLNKNEQSIINAFDSASSTIINRGNPFAQQASNVYYNTPTNIKKLAGSVVSGIRSELLGQTPMSSLTANSLYSRLDTNAFDGNFPITVKVPSLTGESKNVNTNIPLVLDDRNNFWLKMFRGFEGYGGIDGNSDLNNHSFGGVVGYDKAVGRDARLGTFFAYGKTHYSTNYLDGDSNDWRIGFYGDKRHGDWEYQGMVSYGNNHYDLDATTWDSQEKLNSDFKAKIWDVGLKAKYTLPSTKQKTWKIRPYGELGYTHTSQDGYTESGNNAFAKDIDSASNNSTRAELGIEFKRSITPTSGWGGTIGYKRILSGVNPELNGTFVNCTDGFTIRTENDRNYFTYNLNVHTALGGKWTGQAEIRGEKSSNNHKEVYSVAAKYHF